MGLNAKVMLDDRAALCFWNSDQFMRVCEQNLSMHSPMHEGWEVEDVCTASQQKCGQAAVCVAAMCLIAGLASNAALICLLTHGAVCKGCHSAQKAIVGGCSRAASPQTIASWL
jgi:hypothetical protein